MYVEFLYVLAELDFLDLGIGGCSIVVCRVTGLVASFELVGFRRFLENSPMGGGRLF